MSKKKSQVSDGIEMSTGWINVKTLFLTAAMVLIIPILAQGQFPNGYEISGYVTYGATGVSGVTVTAVGIGDFTGYLGLDITDYSGYYNLPVPDGFSGNVEAFKSGYTFDPSSRYYSSVVSDMENQNFSASNGSPPPPPPSITVTSPNGGESWLRGTARNITWISAGDAGSNVRIDLYKDGTLNLKITGSTSNDGSYVWSIPSDQTIGSDYRIKVTSTTNSSYYDYSDNDFSVAEQPRITVTSPNGGESRQQGVLHEITWDSAGDVGSDVRIELYKGGVLNLKITGSTANDGSYDWTVPLDQAIDSDYMIKITSASNPAFFDESDDYFSIDEVSQILFEDTFPSLKIEPKKWMLVSSVKVDDMGINEPSPEYSLRLNGHPSGGDLIESIVMDLSSYADATLTYYYQRTGSGNSPEQGEDLTIEYFDGDSWVELDRQPGDGPDMDYYEMVIIPLPPEALHEGFSFRISNKGSLHASQRYDDWFVDDIKIEVTDDDDDDDDGDDNIAYPVKLIADDGDYGDWFGRRVSISGKYVITGALHDNDDRGSAYIFERSAADWIQQAKLTASSPAAGDQFGCSVSISGDNAIVGADRNDYNGPWSGAAYIFERTNAGWIQQAMLVPSDGRVGDRFGCAVSISRDYAIVGSYWDDDNGTSSGSAYIFRKEVTGWIQEAKLTASDGAKDDWFGYAVSISGNYAIVGAALDDDSGTNRGSVYVFRRSGSSWVQQAKLVAGDGDAGDEFGGSVCLEGNSAVIGAIGADDMGEDSGAAYIFERSGNDWIQQDKLVVPDGAAGDHFGNSVSIDGNYAVAAANLDADMGEDSGSAYIFKREGQSWAQQAKLTAPDGDQDDYFGQWVAIDSSYAVIGAPYDDDNGGNSGSVYIFRRIGTTWIP
ncbi:MAG TPA: hypothetical protein DIU00_21275 [Phycisphaerales bacterium]|nr:hypothetical protein [Phycisphaerales bacterium]